MISPSYNPYFLRSSISNWRYSSSTLVLAGSQYTWQGWPDWQIASAGEWFCSRTKNRATHLRAQLIAHLTPQAIEAVQQRADAKMFTSIVEDILRQTGNG